VTAQSTSRWWCTVIGLHADEVERFSPGPSDYYDLAERNPVRRTCSTDLTMTCSHKRRRDLFFSTVRSARSSGLSVTFPNAQWYEWAYDVHILCVLFQREIICERSMQSVLVSLLCSYRKRRWKTWQSNAVRIRFRPFLSRPVVWVERFVRNSWTRRNNNDKKKIFDNAISIVTINPTTFDDILCRFYIRNAWTRFRWSKYWWFFFHKTHCYVFKFNRYHFVVIHCGERSWNVMYIFH
jgi:hypothetical protein